MKIKLIIIDSFEAEYRPQPPVYTMTEGHIDHWLYSPEGCSKRIETTFA